MVEVVTGAPQPRRFIPADLAPRRTASQINATPRPLAARRSDHFPCNSCGWLLRRGGAQGFGGADGAGSRTRVVFESIGAIPRGPRLAVPTLLPLTAATNFLLGRKWRDSLRRCCCQILCVCVCFRLRVCVRVGATGG